MNEVRLREGVAYADRWLEYQQQHRDIPGMVAAIRYGDALLVSQGYGFANLENREVMTPRHIFRVASHSKTFTATAIMQLKERGELRLDDTIGGYIAWLPDRLHGVTIRQVLNHNAGIVRDGSDADYWQLMHDFPDDAELRRLVEDGAAVLEADEAFKYSNIGYSLLGLVIAGVGGMPYNAYVRRHIVDRLALPDTGPDTDEAVRLRLATGYTPRLFGQARVAIPDVPTHAMSAATGFYSTAEDLCRYAAAHFFGSDDLLSDVSKREMQHQYWTVGRDDEGYGLGFGVATIGGRQLAGHSGGFPGHATRTWFDPRERLAVVVLTNATDGGASALAGTVLRIIEFALASPEPDPAVTFDIERFTGRFANSWGITDVVRFGGRLVAIDPREAEPVKDLTTLEIVDGSTLRMTDPNGYGSTGEAVRYEFDDAGRVVRIIAGGMSSFPSEGTLSESGIVQP